MIIINKKRIVILLNLIVFVVVVCSIQNKIPTENNLKEVVALPVTNKTVILDAGHPRYLLTR